MSISFLCSLFFLKSNDPLLAIVPKLFSNSSKVIPIPLSDIVKVRASLSIAIFISKSLWLTLILSSTNEL